ncbi:MAG: anti-sigma factor [Bacteroidota bacterium]
MNKEQVIKSGLLEQYATGLLNSDVAKEVEGYFQKWPDLQRHVAEMEEMLQEVGKDYDLLHSEKYLNRAKGTQYPRPNSSWKNYVLGLLSVVMLGGMFYFYTENKASQMALSITKEQVNMLEKQLTDSQANLRQILDSRDFFTHPHTARVHLRPLISGKFQGDAIAYYNSTAQQAFLKVVNMPPLSEQQRYQIWADVEGEMEYMGQIQPQVNKMINIPFVPDAVSLNITIEPAAGSEQPTVERLVMHGEISL